MAQKLLNEDIVGQLTDVFQNLDQPVSIIYFGKAEDCMNCEITEQLVNEVADLSELVAVEVYDLAADTEAAARYNVDKAPTLVIANGHGDDALDYGIRFTGAPGGHEFTSLIHDVINVSKRHTDLNEETRSFIEGLDQPVHMQVFVTPTCPYCPQAVMLAHQMAMLSDKITAEMVEATEFPDLAAQFNVSGVPQTTINAGAGTLVGAAPEETLVGEIKKALALS